MIMAIQAQAGAPRWCETAYSGPAAAGAFLRVVPGTTFLCLHRDLDGVFAEALQAYPWGLNGSPLWPYAAGHPGNHVATIGAYWVDRTRALLEFEKDHPESCVRLRYEDLVEDPGSAITATLKTIGVETSDFQALRLPASEPEAVGEAGTRPQLPREWIPPDLEDRIRELRAELGLVS
jgi:Sulfotransferase family